MEIYRHKKTKGLYKRLGKATLQSSLPVTDMTPLVLYQAEDGSLWVRPQSEFNDGRFELLGAFDDKSL